MKLTRSILCFTALGWAGCGDDRDVVPVRNLDRPSDMTFVCMGVADRGGKPVLSARPMAYCHPPSSRDPQVVLDETRALGTFSLVSNTSRGEVAAVDMDRGRLVDLDRALPGYNFVPVGSVPEVITASQDGCRVLTANRGSCDMTLIDSSRLLAQTFGAAQASTGEGPIAQTIVPRTKSGRLQVAPQEVVFLPQPLGALGGNENLCVDDGAYAAAGSRQPWRVLATFPACELVALMEITFGSGGASAQVTSAVYVRPEGIIPAGDDPICPIQCGMGAAAGNTGAPEDGGRTADGEVASADGGTQSAADGSPTPVGNGMLSRPLLVGALALLPSGERAYVGAANAPFVSAIDIKPEGLQVPSNGGRIVLHERPGGVTRLRLSVDPYAVASEALGSFVGKRGHFLYAFARDGSVRVIDIGVNVAVPNKKERECDVNVDPLLLGTAGDPTAACFPMDDPQLARPPRRPLAQGPGIRIPFIDTAELPSPVPRDIAFASLSPSIPERSEHVVDGAFGFLLGSNGLVYLINVDPTPRFDEVPPLTHSFRDGNFGVINAQRGGPPRFASAPIRRLTGSDVPFPTRLTLAPLAGPRLEGVPDPLANQSANVKTWAAFPDRTALAGSPRGPTSWSLVWEGVIRGTDRRTGRIETQPGQTGLAVVSDLGANFCDSGVLPGDILFFPGCAEDLHCGADGRTACLQPTPGVAGLCVPKARVKDEGLSRQCARHLTSRRRYDVVSSSQGQLDIRLRLDEVPKTTLNRCTKNSDCRPTLAHGASDGSGAGFQCVQVQEGDPHKRCVHPCGAIAAPGMAGGGAIAGGGAVKNDAVCRKGMVCEDVAGTVPALGPLCVEAPPIDPECWQGAVTYRVQAGKSYLVSGSMMPRLPTVRAGAGGKCEPDVRRHQLLADRISMDAPECRNVYAGDDASVAALKDLPAANGAWGNPCLFRSFNVDDPEKLPAANSEDPRRVKALFQNSQLRLLLTNLDEYVGDTAIIGFGVTGGFIPAIVEPTVELSITMGVRVVTGPMKTPQPDEITMPLDGRYTSFPYLYLIDQGRSISLGSRGQIVRIDPRSASTRSSRFDPSSPFARDPFQIQ